jgi:hypothetical protein
MEKAPSKLNSSEAPDPNAPIVGNTAWSRILIVEGTSGIGKSTLIDQLVRRYVVDRPPRKLRTLLHLTQAHTYGPVAADEDRKTLTAQQNLLHLGNVVSMLEWYVLSLSAETKIKFLAIIDTLHFTHCHRPGVLNWEHVSGLDHRLARLGSKLLFLHGSSQTIWERGITPRRDEEFITRYARPKFGDTLEEIHQYFVAEQERMRQQLPSTSLIYREMDVNVDFNSYVEEAYEFWLS